MTTASNYQDAYLASLPPEAYDPSGPNQLVQAHAVAAVLGPAEDSATEILDEHDPAQAINSLPDWERNYGLPDPCAGENSTINRRRADLMVAIQGVGDLSINSMVALAARYGYAGATITEFAPATCVSSCDALVFSQDWVYVWSLNVAAAADIHVADCNSLCSDSLRTWGDEALTCAINRAKPAHTNALITYTS